jgi:hypothetical protein
MRDVLWYSVARDQKAFNHNAMHCYDSKRKRVAAPPDLRRSEDEKKDESPSKRENRMMQKMGM